MTVENTKNWLTGALVKPEDIIVAAVKNRERAWLVSSCTE
jgi:hypothetical protein